jgi:hypothetical protein
MDSQPRLDPYTQIALSVEASGVAPFATHDRVAQSHIRDPMKNFKIFEKSIHIFRRYFVIVRICPSKPRLSPPDGLIALDTETVTGELSRHVSQDIRSAGHLRVPDLMYNQGY